MSNGPPIPEIQHFQNLTLKIQGQGHSSRSQSRDNTLSTLIPFVPCQSPVTFLVYNYLKIWHWKFKVKVISEVKVESHNVGPTLSRLTSILFYVNRASHSWVATFSKFVLEKSRAKVMRQVTLRSHNVSLRSYRLTSLSFHVNRASHSWVTTL